MNKRRGPKPKVVHMYENPGLYKEITGQHYIKYFKSIQEASKETGISESSISKCANKRQSHAGGYFWKFD